MKSRTSLIPGFRLTLGFNLFYIGLLILLPIAALLLKATHIPWVTFWSTVSSPRALAAYRLTFTTSFAAAIISGVTGFLIAWVLIRYPFPGRKFLDAIIDFPFALPTAVAGLTFADLYSPQGWMGKGLSHLGITVTYTPLGIILVLVFVGLPFVVRSLEPVLMDMEAEFEEAAASLGANRWQAFRYIIWPTLFPAWITGLALAFARSVGEYGSVVFIAGNLPMKTEIAPLLIMARLEQFDYAGATAIATVVLFVSFALLFLLNSLEKWRTRSA